MISALLLLFATEDILPRVAAEAAYALLQPKPEVAKCCGACKNGIITHGDGHKTVCPCPSTCQCKTKSVLQPQCECPTPRSK